MLTSLHEVFCEIHRSPVVATACALGIGGWGQSNVAGRTDLAAVFHLDALILVTIWTAFPLSNETKIEKDQKDHGMNDGAHAADLRRFNKARAQERHWNAS
jgi:hypothetical protein